MFYAIPLESRPSWRNPPWVTVLLILVNMLVFWGPQRAEDAAQERAAQFYLQSGLPKLELPPFVAWLQETGSPRATVARRLLARERYGELLEGLQQEQAFLRKLHADQIIKPAQAQYADWKRERQRYEAQLPAPFTTRWAQDHNPDAESKPWTWLTSAFLHGSTSHLLGNMLFLFLFGFSVELALGRSLYLGFYLLGAAGASALAAWAYAGQGGYGLGASGAVSALMGMYAVMYRLRRIRFFYQLFFYFNYVTAPALILLPAWIANELLQHLVGGKGIAYMAHLGGLLTGALLMAIAMRWRRLRLPEAPAEKAPDPFEQHVTAARRLAGEMKFEQACTQWRAAAKLRPGDADTLRAWFNTAKLWPAGEDFHRAAHRIFQLRPQDPATLELQHASYKTYLDHAKPGARLRPEDMARLARRFTRAQQFADAERLCQALMKTAPEHPELAETVALCANGLLQAGRRDQALGWLPHLLRLAPEAMVTRMLQKA
ncbi:rhomboid family intramembrane serine protease [Variovorax sp. WS11]|uniref:rhomboid family protein n=1 Tax=Variovorax sp. WS11 TaxID=1105204 RepID=UPI000D0CFDFC|nr:rhomboid family intramembrane serine protease [Variovorax sp. WS11]NDZ15166.1 rhomboid family intramembrane serine protease [Variovorax sp. WS11]PSL85437.1 rhomboid family intramembrane serine protease [Variovorax sp. WS11]